MAVDTTGIASLPERSCIRIVVVDVLPDVLLLSREEVVADTQHYHAAVVVDDVLLLLFQDGIVESLTLILGRGENPHSFHGEAPSSLLVESRELTLCLIRLSVVQKYHLGGDVALVGCAPSSFPEAHGVFERTPPIAMATK